MRPRDPRRLLPWVESVRTRRVARVRIVDAPQSIEGPEGSVTSRQAARLTLPISELERIWTPESLERLARTYWRYLTSISLGLLRVLYTESAREVVLLGRPLVLLRFQAPEYDVDPDGGAVTWRIERGLLVAAAGRGRGYLRISVRRPLPDDPDWTDDDEVTATVVAEVVNFYPMLAAARPGGRPRWMARAARALYDSTQLELHVLVTHGFLRSLARLDLAPSVVRALTPDGGDPPAGGAAGPLPTRSARR